MYVMYMCMGNMYVCLSVYILPYSGLFSRGKIFTNFMNIFTLKLYRCMIIY